MLSVNVILVQKGIWAPIAITTIFDGAAEGLHFWSSDGLLRFHAFAADHAADVRQSRITCPRIQQQKHDLVGRGPACLVQVNEVIAGLAVELEDIEDLIDCSLYILVTCFPVLEVHPIPIAIAN